MKQINEQTLYQAVRKIALDYPNRRALYLKGKFISYKKLLNNINKYAYFLKALGVDKDDVVSIALPNVFSSVYLLYAINQIGAINNLIFPLIKYEQLVKVLTKTKSKILFCLDTSYDEYKGLEEQGILVIPINPLNGCSVILNIGYKHLNKDKLRNVKKARYCSKTINKSKSIYEEYDKEYLKDSFYLQSGGTSGDSKTIALSNYSINALINQFPKLLDLKDGKGMYMFAALPTFHGFGLAMGIHIMLSYGGCDVLIPKFATKEAIKLIKKGMATFIIGIPLLYQALINNKKFDNKKLSTLRYTFVGGDTVPKSLKEKFDNLMIKNNSKARLYEGYGLTEMVTVTSLNTDKYNKEGTVGRLLDNVECKILDENLNDVTYKKDGEIYLTGETIMNGYRFINDESFINLDNKKWIKTGDYGSLDKDRFLYFKQRIKHIIKIKGINLFPKELENSVKELPFIFDCAVTSTKDNKNKEEEIYLFVVIHRDYKSKNYDQEINKKLIDSFGEIAKPKRIIYLDKILKTSLGKVDLVSLTNLIKTK